MKRLAIYLTAITALLSATSLFAQEQGTKQPREGYTVHTVKWFEDLRSIADKYNVPQNVIIKINNLKDGWVSTRQELLIPTDRKYWPASEVSVPAQDTDTAENSTAAPESENADIQDNPSDSTAAVASPVQSLHIALVLPFYSSSASQNNNAMDFYGGVLMAVKKAGEMGTGIELDVYDIAKEQIDGSRLDACDFVMGPIKSDDLKTVLSLVNGSTTVVSPLDPKAEALCSEYPNMVQGACSTSGQFKEAVQWALDERSEGYAHDNYIIISGENEWACVNETAQALKEAGKSFKSIKCTIQGQINGWENSYNPDAMNKVIVASNSEAILNNIITRMSVEVGKAENIKVYAGNRLRSYDTIHIEDIHHASSRIVCPYFIDYKDAATLDFIHKYRALYNCEPSQFAFHGYDLCNYLINTYSQLGKAWSTLISDDEGASGLQAHFKMERTDNGALVNKGMRHTVYESDYKVSLKQ